MCLKKKKPTKKRKEGPFSTWNCSSIRINRQMYAAVMSSIILRQPKVFFFSLKKFLVFAHKIETFEKYFFHYAETHPKKTAKKKKNFCVTMYSVRVQLSSNARSPEQNGRPWIPGTSSFSVICLATVRFF